MYRALAGMEIHEIGDVNWLNAARGDENESPKLFWGCS